MVVLFFTFLTLYLRSPCLVCWPGQEPASWNTGESHQASLHPILRGTGSASAVSVQTKGILLFLACWVNVRIAQWAGVFPAFCKLPHSSCTAQGTPHILSCCHSNLTWCQLSVSVDFWHDSKHPRNQLRGLQVTEIAFRLWWSGTSWWRHRRNESYSHDSQQQNQNKPRSLGPTVLFKGVSYSTESSSLNILPPSSGTGTKPLMHDSRRKLNRTTVFWLRVHVSFLFYCFPPLFSLLK